MEQAKPVARRRHDAQLKCVFRPIVTVDFGIVTGRFRDRDRGATVPVGARGAAQIN